MKIKILHGSIGRDLEGKIKRLEADTVADVMDRDARLLIAYKHAIAAGDDAGRRSEKRVKPDEQTRAETLTDGKALSTKSAGALIDGGKGKK